MAIGFNINQQNMIWAGGGLLAYMFGGKLPLGPLKGLVKIGGIAAAGLGVADILGIFSLSQITSQLPSLSSLTGANYGAWERPHGSYAVDVTNLPYDPNNYYLPPRTA